MQLLFLRKNEEKRTPVRSVGHSNPQKKRLSRRTWCSAGTPLVTPGEVLRFRRDVAEALAAVQLNIFRHRRNHALRTSSRMFSGADSALAFESAPRNSTVSPDHLPPTSAPKTMRCTRQLGVCSLLSPPSIFQGLGASLRTLPPTLALRTVPLATCSHIPVQLRNLVLRGG